MRKKNVSLLLACLLVVSSVVARDVTSFNTGWEFKKGSFSKEIVRAVASWSDKWEKVEIPHTWNAQDMQTRYNDFYEGVGYYRKEYFCPDSLKGKRVFLRFEGVGTCAEVYVNNQLVGTHKGGYSAFVIEIGTALKSGENNEIVVKADNKSRPDVIPVNHVLFGVYGGIYRPVWLVVTEKSNITVTDNASSGVYIKQKNVSKRSADVTVTVKVDNASLHPVPLILENLIYTQEGKLITSGRQSLSLTSQGTQTYASAFRLNKPHLWQGRQNPYLYKVVSRLVQEGKVIDEVVQPWGYGNMKWLLVRDFS